MIYRRFGRTEQPMSVLTCGGMRYQHAWQDVDLKEVPKENQENLEATIHRALELGINHIETARGYGSSEAQLGLVLPKVTRDDLLVQTKVAPAAKAKDFLATFETSMQRLQLDHVDLLSMHGINNAEILEWTVRKGGCLDAARQLQKEGRARFIGFSTHAPLDIILAAIDTGEFDYVNLHWYYFDQINEPALRAARKQDMGVFIISPSDKGGMLYAPPPKLVDLCQPLTPMGFNDLFCLTSPDVDTISLGAARPSDFDKHMAIIPALTGSDGNEGDLANARAQVATIGARIEDEMRRVLGAQWSDNWHKGLPGYADAPGEAHLYHILRLYNLAVALDMVEFARTRYNLLGNGDHWFPGNKADRIDWERLAPAVAASPVAGEIETRLRAAEKLLHGEEQKRLSESD